MPVKRKAVLLVFLLVLVLALVTAVAAQFSSSYDLSWHVIAGGGNPSGSAAYQVNGTAGQAIAGPPDAASASFRISSGYWTAGARSALYLPVISK